MVRFSAKSTGEETDTKAKERLKGIRRKHTEGSQDHPAVPRPGQRAVLQLVNSFEDPYQEFISMKDIYLEDHNQVNQGEKFKSFATKGVKHKSLPGGVEVYVPCLAYVKKIKTRFTT
ncbi:hypothetical protein DUI87_25287 [Hirundo rustica rustica]|uniref:Uncharacterized protein n=1 Tax=Hirundo rustica rustica TaxID=333673 RepID=A0A3M0JB97_HIRRU|nr:hypothetical protein DUI87_25287 [Hirundo rustica rustica]